MMESRGFSIQKRTKDDKVASKGREWMRATAIAFFLVCASGLAAFADEPIRLAVVDHTAGDFNRYFFGAVTILFDQYYFLRGCDWDNINPVAVFDNKK